jgi:hypothetical protein
VVWAFQGNRTDGIGEVLNGSYPRRASETIQGFWQEREKGTALKIWISDDIHDFKTIGQGTPWESSKQNLPY